MRLFLPHPHLGADCGTIFWRLVAPIGALLVPASHGAGHAQRSRQLVSADRDVTVKIILTRLVRYLTVISSVGRMKGRLRGGRHDAEKPPAALLAANGLLSNLENCTLVGTAGTATTLAAISMKMTVYDYRLVNNYVLELHEIRKIFSRLLPLSPEERLSVTGLEKGREDLIIAGILITLKTMETIGFKRLKVSDYGLLEGVLLSICS